MRQAEGRKWNAGIKEDSDEDPLLQSEDEVDSDEEKERHRRMLQDIRELKSEKG